MTIRRALLVAFLIALLVRAAVYLVHVRSGDHNWPAAFHRFDSYWYERIATTGYPDVDDRRDLGWTDSTGSHQSEWAFFPLYPMLARAVAELTGASIPQAMEVLSWVFALAALVSFKGFARRLLPPHEAGLALMAFALFPFAVFLHVHYAEALFLFVLLTVFNCLIDDRRWQAALLLAILVLVRPNGLFVLPVAVLFLVEQRRSVWRTSGILLMFVPTALAFSAYCYFQYVHTGEAFAFSLAQAGWGRDLSWPWTGFFKSGDLATQIESIYTIALVVLALVVRKRMPLSYNVLLWTNILVPLCSGSVDSITRFTLVLFPLFLLAGPWLATIHVRWRIVLGCIGLTLQLVCAWLWATGHPLMA